MILKIKKKKTYEALTWSSAFGRWRAEKSNGTRTVNSKTRLVSRPADLGAWLSVSLRAGILNNSRDTNSSQTWEAMQTFCSKKTILSLFKEMDVNVLEKLCVLGTGRWLSGRQLSRKQEAMHWIVEARHTLSRFWQPCCLCFPVTPVISGSACSQVCTNTAQKTPPANTGTTRMDKHCSQACGPHLYARVSSTATQTFPQSGCGWLSQMKSMVPGEQTNK